MILIAAIVAFVALVIGSITDIQKREVHDYVSYGLRFIAFGIAVIYSIINWNYTELANSLIGFVLGWGIAYIMFYSGQWGGGDSKLLMGLGAVIGFNVFNIFGQRNLWLVILLIAIVFVGAIYGVGWSIYLAIKNKKNFVSSLKQWAHKKEIIKFRRILIIGVIALLIIIVLFIPMPYKLLFVALLALLYILFYIWLFVKVIEDSCMIKDIPISKLTEGDWIYKNVSVNGKYVTGPKELGITKEQINKLKKSKLTTVTIKEGIPFIPAITIAYAITIILYYSGITIF